VFDQVFTQQFKETEAKKISLTVMQIGLIYILLPERVKTHRAPCAIGTGDIFLEIKITE
jgi:hypothetical protein